MGYLVVTGAAGFIASNLAKALNMVGHSELILSDKFDRPDREQNLRDVVFSQKIDRDVFPEWLLENAENVDLVFHLGARTDTTEFNFRVLDSLNLSYSKSIWEICTAKQLPLIYASSAATYGLGEFGFSDDHKGIDQLKPLNPYGVSKQLFDIHVLQQSSTPPFWCGLKFFNVYGPNEFHKGRMASVALHAFKQIQSSGKLKLFKSHHPDFKDGEQLRDFIHVNDIVSICLHFMSKSIDRKYSGIYNAGTGVARSFNDLAHSIFAAMNKQPEIEYIDTPLDIRDKYQYYTKAETAKLLHSGFSEEFISLEKGIAHYVDFLMRNG